MTSAVSAAKRKAPAAICQMPKTPPTMTRAAPKAAPDEMPRVKGEARGLRSTAWDSTPPMASPPPTRAPMTTRGSRNCQKIRDSEAVAPAKGSDQPWGPRPRPSARAAQAKPDKAARAKYLRRRCARKSAVLCIGGIELLELFNDKNIIFCKNVSLILIDSTKNKSLLPVGNDGANFFKDNRSTFPNKRNCQ